MSRPASRVSVLLVVAALAASACGDVAPPAAVVDGHEISLEALEAEVARALSDPGTAAAVGAPGDAERKSFTRDVLGFLIRQQLVADEARRRGLAVSPEEVDRELAEAAAQFGGMAALEEELARRGRTLERFRRDVERFLLERMVHEGLAADTGLDPQEAFFRWFLDRVASGAVEVNPRFGRIDPRTGAVVQISSTG